MWGGPIPWQKSTAQIQMRQIRIAIYCANQRYCNRCYFIEFKPLMTVNGESESLEVVQLSHSVRERHQKPIIVVHMTLDYEVILLSLFHFLFPVRRVLLIYYFKNKTVKAVRSRLVRQPMQEMVVFIGIESSISISISMSMREGEVSSFFTKIHLPVALVSTTGQRRHNERMCVGYRIARVTDITQTDLLSQRNRRYRLA